MQSHSCQNKVNGTPDRIRTCDLWLRKPTLYPAKLRVHIFLDYPNLLYKIYLYKWRGRIVGLVRYTRNVVWEQFHRGFKSLPLRQKNYLF